MRRKEGLGKRELRRRGRREGGVGEERGLGKGAEGKRKLGVVGDNFKKSD